MYFPPPHFPRPPPRLPRPPPRPPQLPSWSPRPPWPPRWRYQRTLALPAPLFPNYIKISIHIHILYKFINIHNFIKLNNIPRRLGCCCGCGCCSRRCCSWSCCPWGCCCSWGRGCCCCCCSWGSGCCCCRCCCWDKKSSFCWISCSIVAMLILLGSIKVTKKK